MKTYNRKIGGSASKISAAFKRNKKPFIILFAIIAIVIVGIILIYQLSIKQGFGSSFLVTEDTIKIGIRTDIERFGQFDETGEIVGFDRDFIDEALSRLLPSKQKMFEYYSITSQNAGPNIKYGVTNLNLGLIVDGTKKVSSFRISRPYYTDSVVAVVPGSSRIEKLSNMGGGKIGAFDADIPKDNITSFLKGNGMDETYLRYYDYESAMTDIEQNRVNAVIMPLAMARQFEAAGFRILAEPLFEVGYSVMLPTGQAAFTTELDRVIGEMQRDGTLDELRRKWGL